MPEAGRGEGGESGFLLRIYQLLLRQYGPQGWWPGDTPFEVCVGAILTQNTNWRNVERAIANLREQGMLTAAGMNGAALHRLAEAIRPSGYYNVKSRRLKGFLEWLFLRYGGEVEGMLAGEWQPLRAELLAVPGIGPETADSILLYAAGKPTFVVDAYTRRLLARLGVMGEGSRYEEVRRYFMDRLPVDAPLFNEYHALVVRHAKERCRTRPQAVLCAGCGLGREGHCLHPVAASLFGPVEGLVGLADQ
jgi:endonuclease-3 related protein